MATAWLPRAPRLACWPMPRSGSSPIRSHSRCCHTNKDQAMTGSHWRSIAFAMLIGSALASPAAAQNDSGQNEAGQQPPAEIALKDCVSEDSGFREHNGSPAYVITLINKCERRFSCKVNVNVTNAYGSVHGQATLRLGPHAAGDVATKTYALKVKSLG